MASASVASVERRYADAGLVAAVAVTLGWHAVTDLPLAVSGWSLYRPAAAGLSVWVAYTIIGVATSVVMLRGGGQTRVLAAVTIPLLLAGVAVVAVASPTHSSLDPFSWAIEASGWFALVVLWRRPTIELIAFFVVNNAVGAVTLISSGETDRVSIARCIMVAYGISVLPVATLLGSRALTALAARMAEQQDAIARTANRQAVARAVHEIRQARSEHAQQVAAHLLSKIAANTIDLRDRATQQRLRVAVSRLRRLIVETDDVPEPLQHELRACADASERRGIEVDLQRPVGEVPPLPVRVRRALTEPVIQALAAARTWARVTVVATPEEVSVAVIADAPRPDSTPQFPEAEYAYDDEGGQLWVQTRWTRTS